METMPICSKEVPKPKGDSRQWKHPSMRVIEKVEDLRGNTYDVYECPHCGFTKRVETVD